MYTVLQAVTVVVHFGRSHVFFGFFLGRGGGAAQSVRALYFQHEGTHCHVMEQA